MTFFREALRRFDPLSIVPAPLPETGGLVEREQDFRQLFWNVETTPPDDLADAAARIVPALEAGETLTWRDWSLSPWLLWRAEPAVARRPKAFERFADHVEREGTGRTIRTLARVFLVHFDPDAPRLTEVSELVGRSLRRASGRYARLQRDSALFMLPDGPRGYAERCVARDMSYDEAMTELAFDGDERRGGFARLVHQEGAAVLAARHVRERNAASARAMARWRRKEDEATDEDDRPAFVNALLTPFEEAPPEPETKEALLHALLQRLGDPRLDVQAWARTSEAARRTARLWATELSLRQYFEIVDDAAFQDHWPYRLAFWKAYFDRGHIEDAWVAFGPRGAERARAEFGEEARFAHLVRGERGRVEPSHAALLVRIGAAIFADWSHRGGCHVWAASDEAAPTFYRLSYPADDLMRDDRASSERVFRHANSEDYGWQGKLAERIFEATGVRVPKEAYELSAGEQRREERMADQVAS